MIEVMPPTPGLTSGSNNRAIYQYNLLSTVQMYPWSQCQCPKSEGKAKFWREHQRPQHILLYYHLRLQLYYLQHLFINLVILKMITLQILCWKVNPPNKLILLNHLHRRWHVTCVLSLGHLKITSRLYTYACHSKLVQILQEQQGTPTLFHEMY